MALDGFTIQRIVSVVVNGAALCRNQAQDGSTMFTLSALCLTCLWPALNSGDNVVGDTWESENGQGGEQRETSDTSGVSVEISDGKRKADKSDLELQ